MLAGKSHTGWKAIAARLGVRDVRTARKLAVKYKLPIITMGRSPSLDEDIYRVWMVNYMEALREKDGGNAEDAHLRGRRQNP